jgi:alkylated DNA nucleotide flippase Atl1
MVKARSLDEAVFEVVKKIKPGQVLSYKQVARRIGKPNAFRFVAWVLKTRTLLSRATE